MIHKCSQGETLDLPSLVVIETKISCLLLSYEKYYQKEYSIHQG